MKKILLGVCLFAAFLLGCQLSPFVDSTPPIIDGAYVDPFPVFNGHPFTLIVSAHDPESDVSLSYDMDNDGVFDDSNSGFYYTSGSKNVAVRATSEGGSTTNFYVIDVNTVELHLLVSYTAVSSSYSGSFTIDYGITNHCNVPIRITSGGYIIYGSAYGVLTDIVKTKDTLLINTFIPVGNTLYAELDGYSISYVPYYFDFGFAFDDGYGNGTTSYFTGGSFVVY